MGKNMTNTELMSFYASRELKDSIVREAKKLGIGVGQFVRMILMKELEVNAE